jgi:hypothetical protein
MVGVGGGACAVGPVLFAAADPNHVVKQSSPIGRTNLWHPFLRDKSRFIVLNVGRAVFVENKEIEGSTIRPR